MSVKTYSPVAGLTIEEAIQRAIQMAKKENVTVLANINDIFLSIKADTHLDDAYNTYQKRLKRVYEDKLKQNIR